LEKIKFKLSGLPCESCTSSISKALNRFSEIKEVEVEINQATIVVDENSSEIINKVISKITRLGYQAEPL